MYGVRLDKQRVGELLKDFYTLTGIRIAFISHDFRYFHAIPEETCGFCAALRKDPKADRKCRECDQEAYSRALKSGRLYLYECHAGLTEAVAPICIEGTVLGYLMMGQTAGGVSDTAMWEDVKRRCTGYSVDIDLLQEHFGKLARLSRERLESAARIMEQSAKYIYLTKLVQMQTIPFVERLKSHVGQNIRSLLSIPAVCSELGVSSSFLSHKCKEVLGMSFMQYVRKVRLDKAQQLLAETSLSISQVAQETGLEDANYFSRLFRREYKVSPTVYRIKTRENAEMC